MDKSDFKVMARRVPGYEPLVSLRFEMKEGFGELLVGDQRKASPAAVGEVTEVTGEQLRAGRFVHVLSSGRRRQSYALSRIDDDRMQRLPDDRWTDLEPLTEFGIRYLDLPELEPPSSVAVVQVSANPAPERTRTPRPASPRPASASALPPRPAPVSSVSVRPAPERSGSPVASASARPAPPRTATARDPSPTPPPAASSEPGAPIAIERGLGQDAVRRLSIDELRQRLLAEMDKVRTLIDDVAERDAALEASRARERDLLEILARWQERG